MVSRICLGYIVSPYAIMSFEFSVMNIYKISRNWRTNAEECGVAIKLHVDVSWLMIVQER